MTLEKAIKLACQAIDVECKRLAVNANLYELYGVDACRLIAERRGRLRHAKRILSALESGRREDDDNKE